MNQAAEKFNAYLRDKKIESFQIREMPEQNNAVLFQSLFDINGTKLPVLVIFDNSAFTTIRVLIAGQIFGADNQLPLLKLANDGNLNYKPFKLYFNDEGDFVLDCYLLTAKEVSGEDIYFYFEVIVNYLQNNYQSLKSALDEKPQA